MLSILVTSKILSFGKWLTLQPDHQILDLTKLKAFKYKEIDVVQMMISVFDRVENIVGKTDNFGLPSFSPFPAIF